MWPRKCGESRNISKSVPNLFSSTHFSRMKLFYYNITFFYNVIISKYFVSNITQSGPFFSFIVIWYRPFDNNDIRDRRPFHPGTGISSARITLSHIRGCKPLSEPLAHWANLSLLSVSRYLTIPLQHLSVSSKESLYKHTKALFAKFLFKFADKTASSSISSWVNTVRSTEFKVELSECKRKHEVDIEEKNKIIGEKEKNSLMIIWGRWQIRKNYSLVIQSQMLKTISKQINQYNFVKPIRYPLHLCTKYWFLLNALVWGVNL